MSILVTGGAGFIGSHLCRALLAQGEEVTVIDDLSTGSYDNLADLEGNQAFRLIVEDVNNQALVDDCVRHSSAVYHLASAVGVRLIIEQPVRTIHSIVGGTESVLKACARYRRPFLLTSSSEVYGKGSKVPFAEDDDSVMGATSTRRWSYACAKALDEFLALAHWVETRLPVVIVRLFNTVGPRQTGQYGMVLPNFVRQALNNQPIMVHGDGMQSRCFAHVQDVVEALLALMACPQARGQVVNVGNDDEISIFDLACRIKEQCGSSSEIQKIPYEQAYGEGFDDMRRRVPDLSKVHRLIGYKAKRDLQQIIADVIQEMSKTNA
ncbi:MAG: NAD-dependent epimerase/dehydratase family protein [Lentisphaeria bacterium]|nr:GDP-mannose 4,6-dehydratase [Lentisphaeria bacterium]NLZ59299.1 NAD-dependent epimerase/dehydratase family protein [Lentisphaerota bacterium]